MHKTSITLFLLLLTVSVLSQEPDENITDMIQGIEQESVAFYEVAGYQIFHQKLNKAITEKSIKKFNKKYGFPKDLVPEKKSLDGEYLLFKSDRINSTEKSVLGKSYYTYENENRESFVIGFTYLSSRDTAIEHFMTTSIRRRNLPKSVYSPQSVDSIKFAGRYIQLGPACRWMNTHNIQCPNYGQMNWSEFSDSTRAAEMTEFQRLLNNQKFLGKEKESESVDVLFEGNETKALRTIVKMKVPELVMGGSNVLIVYYVTSKVRDRYVSAVLSHYTDDINADDLPPLLGEVMKLK